MSYFEHRFLIPYIITIALSFRYIAINNLSFVSLSLNCTPWNPMQNAGPQNYLTSKEPSKPQNSINKEGFRKYFKIVNPR